MTAKKRNPQDATRRNVQAANKKIRDLEARVLAVERGLKAMGKLVTECPRIRLKA